LTGQTNAQSTTSPTLNMASKYLAKCPNHGTNATTRCAGCMDAPARASTPGHSTTVIYCGLDRQKGHWSNRKAHCSAMRHRKKLFREAKLLKVAPNFQGGTLHPHQNPRSITPRSKRSPFRRNLASNIEHNMKVAALARNRCTTAMALPGRLS
jgi:hypothetical protein